MKLFLHLSNEVSVIYDIHDTLKAYYKVAIKCFIDNVKNQVIQQNLLGLSGPVNIFRELLCWPPRALHWPPF